MNDDTLKRRADILAAIHETGASQTRDGIHDFFALFGDVPGIDEDIAALVAAGLLVRDGGRYGLSHRAHDAMSDARYVAAVELAAESDWPHLTLADCAAWAEAIVVALEAEGLTSQRVYGDALFLARSTAIQSPRVERTALDGLRWLVLAEARAGQLRIARAYAAIIAVRMLAAEAARREQT